MSRTAIPNDFDHVVLDIEGTTTPIAFVHEVLFPYAADNVEAFLEAHWDEAGVQQDVQSLRELAASEEGLTAIPEAGERAAQQEAVLAVVRQLMAEDRKATGLKSLQGRIWREGYARGELQGQIFDDVPQAFERWRARGLTLYIYSSGSIEAQKLIFGFSDKGDLTPCLAGYFDTTTGPKRETDSYRKIAQAIGAAPERVIFLTDVVAEADAARQAGLQAAVLERPGNPPAPPHDHPVLRDFAAL